MKSRTVSGGGSSGLLTRAPCVAELNFSLKVVFTQPEGKSSHIPQRDFRHGQSFWAKSKPPHEPLVLPTTGLELKRSHTPLCG